jgi:hypothetical protein
MNHQEALNYLENRLVTVTNGIFHVSGLLIKQQDCYCIDVTEIPNKSITNVCFKLEYVESIDVNEEAFLPNIPEIDRYMIILRG